MMKNDYKNPFRPGAGHMPPYLAGRKTEKDEFSKLLNQDVILDNFVLTGFRGVGKTVLLETLKTNAISRNWCWIGADLSEASSISEENIVIRLLTDLSVLTSNYAIPTREMNKIGFVKSSGNQGIPLNYKQLLEIYADTPGLISDKLKSVLNFVWACIKPLHKNGLIFAYDEAQNLSDHASKEQYPLSLLLDVFQSIQRSETPFMLILTGLPALFPKLVDARTYSERMFRVLFLSRLDESDSKDAILKPVEDIDCPVLTQKESVKAIVEYSGGYPYFIQFMCREIYDSHMQNITSEQGMKIPMDEIMRKLDTDFFAGRWAKVTDRQRQLLEVIAQLDHSDARFTVQEIVALSKEAIRKPFSASHVTQMLASLIKTGLIYKNRHGEYSFAVPLFNAFISRQMNKSFQTS